MAPSISLNPTVTIIAGAGQLNSSRFTLALLVFDIQE